LLRNAAKARIRRMISTKKKRTDLSVPSWIGDEWNKGTKEREQMALCLQEVNWNKVGFEHSFYLHLQGLQQSLGLQPLEAMDINLSNPQDKFVDEMQRIITSRKRVSIKKDQGWYSEAEMKSDLKWSQHLGLN